MYVHSDMLLSAVIYVESNQRVAYLAYQRLSWCHAPALREGERNSASKLSSLGRTVGGGEIIGAREDGTLIEL